MRKIKIKNVVILILAIVAFATIGYYLTQFFMKKSSNVQEVKVEEKKENPVKEDEIKKIKISANGDLLYHIGLIHSAKNENGYDFSENFELIKPLISSMDYAIGDYEGSINEEYPLSGYPLFNAPKIIAKNIADAGYDMMSLANNHILDSNIEGLQSTYQYFKDVGITPIGVSVEKNQRVVIKNIKGIKVAFVAYTYGFNGMEVNVPVDKEYMLHDLNRELIKQDLEEAEKNADITVAFPHMGDEYHLEPNEEQKKLYHEMVEWGADIIFGNHTHVAQIAEMVKKDNMDKYIIYSMGNLISNQRIETLDGIMNKEWTERGVIIEASISKKNDEKAKLDEIIYHPTWVRRTPRGRDSVGNNIYKYQILLTEQYLNDKKDLTDDEWNRVKNTHFEMLEHLKIK